MRDAAEATILVTGATDGLGRRMAQELAAKGATVLLHGCCTAAAPNASKPPSRS